jgi:DNA polymerase III delta subunit
VKAIQAIIGPRDAGPGERQEMLDLARRIFEEAGVDSIDRIDVPGRGAGEDTEGVLRVEVERIVPALQSGSLFGGTTGLLVVDAQSLHKAEAEVVATLMDGLDSSSVVLVLVSLGALPSTIQKLVRDQGESHSVKKMRERDALAWIREAARDRRVKIDAASAEALVQRFGSDVASLGQALDQLSSVAEEITPELIGARFRNRPDEPMWHFADAVAAGDTGGALRRLADFLTHAHPLQLLSFLENDLKRRSLAAAAPDIETFAEWVGASPDHFPTKKAWNARASATPEDLRKALDALSRADIALKTMPEATHRLTMERLTVALTRWYRGAARSTG